MKNLVCVLVFFILSANISAQDWTWMNGPTIINTWGYYGTMGVPSPTVIPGTRHGAARWVDASGNLYLFGGEGLPASGTSGWLNDMWKYDISTGEWVWLHGSSVKNQAGIYGTMGVSSPSNCPGGREFAASWVDASGKFWMFGGDGYSGAGVFGNLNDLWRYDPSTNEWTWINGSTLSAQNGNYGTKGVSSPSNQPGGRWSPVVRQDVAGNVWMFAGYGWPASGGNGDLNDLWKYDPVTNEWTWVSGSNLINQYGSYGTKGASSPSNMPGSRDFASGWMDNAGNLWVFGGYGYPAPTSGGVAWLNDLWKYNISSNEWTWMSGTTYTNQNGNYGAQNVTAPSNMPGSRYSSASWTDASGNFYLFAGFGYPSSGSFGRLNDIWKYNPSTSMWTWLKGSNMADKYGTYGTQGVSNPSNTPGARDYEIVWQQQNGDICLFGGFSFPVSGAPGNMNDLWRYNPTCAPDDMSPSSELSICENDSATLFATSTGTGTISWYSSPTSTIAIGTGTSITTPPLSAGSYVYYAEVSSCTVSPRTSIAITVNSYPTLTVTSSNSLVCSGQSVTLTVGGALSYTWNASSNGFSLAVSPTVNTTYTVIGENAGCRDTATITQGVDPCLGISELQTGNFVSLYPNPNNGEFKISSAQSGSIEVFNSLGEKVIDTEIKEGENTLNFPEHTTGVYLYTIRYRSGNSKNGKLVVE